MRLIDSNALIGALHNVTFEDGTDREIVYKCVELAQTIEERKTGKWIVTSRNGVMCSECKSGTRKMPMLFGNPLYKYCPFCGAKMEGVGNGTD